jgi:hypothetical protein
MAGKRCHTGIPTFLTVPAEYTSPFSPQLKSHLFLSHGRLLEIARQAHTKQFPSQFFNWVSASQSKLLFDTRITFTSTDHLAIFYFCTTDDGDTQHTHTHTENNHFQPNVLPTEHMLFSTSTCHSRTLPHKLHNH